MPEMTTYPQGTPAWVDLWARDLESAQAFYAAVLGWDYEALPGGGYTFARRHARPVAGMTSLGQDSSFPVMWATYLAVDDVDAVTKTAETEGATVLMPPSDAGPYGRVSVVTDPTGATVGFWQGGTLAGAELVNEHGAITWNELITADPDRARAFYSAVVGVGHEPARRFPGYTMIQVGDRGVGGIGDPASGTVPPPMWAVYFSVEDVDAAVATATGLGAQLLSEPTDTPVGRLATLRDPDGATFCLAGDTLAES